MCQADCERQLAGALVSNGPIPALSQRAFAAPAGYDWAPRRSANDLLSALTLALRLVIGPDIKFDSRSEFGFPAIVIQNALHNRAGPTAIRYQIAIGNPNSSRHTDFDVVIQRVGAYPEIIDYGPA